MDNYYLLITDLEGQIETIGPFKGVVERDVFLTRWIILHKSDKGVELDVVDGQLKTSDIFTEYDDEYPVEALVGAPVSLIDTSEEAGQQPHEITAVNQGGAYDIEVTNLKTNEPCLVGMHNIELVRADHTEFKAQMAEQRSKIATQNSEGVDGIGLTIENHVENKGTKCPYCESSDLQGKTPRTTINTRIAMPVKCNVCGKEWEDTYELTGYSGK